MRVGFDVEALEEKQITNPILVPLDFTNAICYGQTGSGKTSTFILPNIHERIMQRQSVVVFDFKGNMHLKVKCVADNLGRLKDVLEIGVLWGESLNLLDGLSEKEIDTLLSTRGFDKDYWDIASLSLFKSLYFSLLELRELYTFLKKYNASIESGPLRAYDIAPTFSAIYALIKPSEIEKHMGVLGGAVGLIHKTLVESETLQESIKLQHALSHFEKKFKQFAFELSSYKHIKDEDRDSGNHAVMNSLKNMIQDLARIPFLNNPYAKPIGELIENKIVVINSENIGKSATQIINARLFAALKKRAGDSKAQGVTIFIDEAHKIITPKTLPEVSVCRECRFEYIMATQDELLLKRSVGELETEEMLVNVAFVISYKNITDERCKDFEPFYYLKGDVKGKAAGIFFSSLLESMVEQKFQEQRGFVEAQTTIEKKGGYLLNDTDLFGRESAYYVDLSGKKSVVKIFPRMNTEVLEDKRFLEEHKKQFWMDRNEASLESRVNDVERVITKLIHLSKKESTPVVEPKAPIVLEEKRTVKMILRDANKQIIAVRYFKAKKDAAELLCKLRPRTHEELAFFKTMLKTVSKKDRLLEVRDQELFLELPYDLLLYVSLPKEDEEKMKLGAGNGKSA